MIPCMMKKKNEEQVSLRRVNNDTRRFTRHYDVNRRQN
jgi:hypothetical protein